MNNPPPFEKNHTDPAHLLVGDKRIHLTGTTLLVGRHTTNDLVLEHESISSHHAVIKANEDGFVLVDMDSTNGTFLNGEKVTEVQLTDNDQIMFGSVETFFIQPQMSSSAFSLEMVAPNHPIPADKAMPLPFSWWPRNRLISFLAAVFFGVLIIFNVAMNPFAAVFFVLFFYVPMTGVRYFKYWFQTPRTAKHFVNAKPAGPRPFWWHPAFIGSAFAALVVLLTVMSAASHTKDEMAVASQYRQANQAALEEHTSFGSHAEYAIATAANVYAGDVITPLVQGIDHYSTTQELQTRIKAAEAYEQDLASTRQNDGGVIFIAVMVLLVVGGVIFWKIYAWIKKEWSTVTLMVMFAFPASSFAETPPAGLVLDNGWASPMHGGIAAMKELGSLLSPFARPSPNVAAAPEIEIYQGVTYLMPYAEAKQKLGLTQNIVPKNKVITAGFPKDSLFHYAFDGIFDGGFNKLYIVTDKADQVVAVQLVCESPRRDMLRDIYTAPDWSMYNFINNRRKATTRLWVDHQTHFLRTGSWREYRKASGYAHPEGKETVIRIDSALMDPDSLKGSNYRGQEWKLLEVSQLYLPKPLMELMMHYIGTTGQR